MAATATAVAAVALAWAPANAASAGGTTCLLLAGGGARCTADNAEAERIAAANTHVVTVWENPGYTGVGIQYFKPGGGCTAESDFSPADYGFDIPLLNGARWVSSVRKVDTGHCNWVLVGPSGGRSTEVEGDWPRLSELGDGWDNRAVRILVD
ncbi:hypothetical protein [Actinokineospora bangkokensis]|uniref:Peptidase inhibitor family I36 protein n=1 Tax=Actinokineospora bangkokensis TaxID=1193682 RepID=A0A1Q9LIW1_9PSEU|nr:hypothetical protein [Actinokineospora bangkokensis]OLR91992.1 hypothetical protein BJP25_24570 [Actinokineospora bangkokensis]